MTKVGTTPGNPITFNTDAQQNIYMGFQDSSPVYMLDSPDLPPLATSVPSLNASASGRAGHGVGRLMAVGPDSRLDAGAFGNAAGLEIHSLDGKKAGYVRRGDSRRPLGLKEGLYLLIPTKPE